MLQISFCSQPNHLVIHCYTICYCAVPPSYQRRFHAISGNARSCCAPQDHCKLNTCADWVRTPCCLHVIFISIVFFHCGAGWSTAFLKVGYSVIQYPGMSEVSDAYHSANQPYMRCENACAALRLVSRAFHSNTWQYQKA